LERDQLRGAAAKSNGVLRELGTDIRWVEATKITEVRKMIAPTTEHST
jgi:hypothetical protein